MSLAVARPLDYLTSKGVFSLCFIAKAPPNPASNAGFSIQKRNPRRNRRGVSDEGERGAEGKGQGAGEAAADLY